MNLTKHGVALHLVRYLPWYTTPACTLLSAWWASSALLYTRCASSTKTKRNDTSIASGANSSNFAVAATIDASLYVLLELLTGVNPTMLFLTISSMGFTAGMGIGCIGSYVLRPFIPR